MLLLLAPEVWRQAGGGWEAGEGERREREVTECYTHQNIEHARRVSWSRGGRWWCVRFRCGDTPPPADSRGRADEIVFWFGLKKGGFRVNWVWELRGN